MSDAPRPGGPGDPGDSGGSDGAGGSGGPRPTAAPPSRLRVRLPRLFRTLYGESPFHLLVLLASFALCAYAAQRLLQGDWFAIVEWFVGAALIHDLVLVPLYGGADWLLHRGVRDVGRRPEPADRDRSELRIAVVNHIRVPAFLSLLLLLVYWPSIAQRAGGYYALTTRLDPSAFLPRWLLVTAALFAASGLLFALRRWRAAARARGPRQPRRARGTQE